MESGRICGINLILKIWSLDHLELKVFQDVSREYIPCLFHTALKNNGYKLLGDFQCNAKSRQKIAESLGVQLTLL